MKFIRTTTGLTVLLGLLATGCEKADAQKDAKKGAGAGGPPVIQVVAVKVERHPVKEALSLVGTLAANESVEIRSEIDGSIQEIHFKEGDLVKKGSLIIKLDDTKLAASLKEAEANYALALANFERNKQLYKDSLISKQEYDQSAASFQANDASVELKRRELKDTRIYAPFTAVASSRLVSPGQVITKSTVLTYLVDIDPVKAEFSVPERFLGELHPGQNVELKVAAFPDRTFTGKVFFVSPFLDASTRSALVKATLPNPEHELKPGMFANLDLELALRENAVVIPEAALSQVRDGNRAMVFIVDEKGTVQYRALKLGIRLPRFVEVVDGLKGGETLVVEGVQKLGPGAKVKFAPKESAEPYLWDNPEADKPRER